VGSNNDVMKMTKMLYILKCLYFKDPLFNINIHHSHLFAETPALLQKFVTLCRTVSERIAYFMTKVSHTALYFRYQWMEGAEPRVDWQQLQHYPYPVHCISWIW